MYVCCVFACEPPKQASPKLYDPDVSQEALEKRPFLASAEEAFEHALGITSG